MAKREANAASGTPGLAPPVEPMLAKLADDVPAGAGWLYEPKWDGFRAIAFRGAGDVFIQSRDLRPLDRYFPELHQAFLSELPDGCVVDGEIVIATPAGLDFDALQMRLHPAASRVARQSVVDDHVAGSGAGARAPGRSANAGWRRRQASSRYSGMTRTSARTGMKFVSASQRGTRWPCRWSAIPAPAALPRLKPTFIA
jgi:hypothetical protein